MCSTITQVGAILQIFGILKKTDLYVLRCQLPRMSRETHLLGHSDSPVLDRDTRQIYC